MSTADAELPPSNALALPIVINIPSSRPTTETVGSVAAVLLQISHRAGTVALLAVLGTGYLAFSGHEFYAALACASGCAIAGLCCAILTLSFARRGGRQWREAVGVGAFNATIAVLGLILMLVARAGVIQDSIREGGASLRSSVQDFFTAPPTLPPQP